VPDQFQGAINQGSWSGKDRGRPNEKCNNKGKIGGEGGRTARDSECPTSSRRRNEGSHCKGKQKKEGGGETKKKRLARR